MKCTINSIRNIELNNNRIGSRVEGFTPIQDITIIPEHILKWMSNYKGVKATLFANGISITAWAETVCSEKDTYDTVRGSHIAESKAKAKIYRFLRNYAGYMSDYLEALSNDFQDAYLKYDHCVDHEEEHMEFLGNSND